MNHDNALPPEWRKEKEKLKQVIRAGRWGVLTDVDGTISRIVDVPDAAEVSPAIKRLLGELSQHAVVVAAVSGRAATDIRQRVGVPGLIYIGNHGFERWVDGELRPAAAIESHLPALARAKAAVAADAPEGMWVEDKGATLSIHYRQTADPAAVEQQYRPRLQELANQTNLKLFSGRMVFELRPPVKCDKGTAVAGLIDEFNLDGAIFLGDDVTDVDAMKTLRRVREQRGLATVAVGVYSDDMPSEVRLAADCLASGVDGVEALLAWLLKEVRASLT